ncbi:MAG TPA: malto-oligosyltrehalose trehalohydrolase [Alphaproteobacteria bacterium]
MVGFVHQMPFGACLDDGSVRFRLWAPGQTAVSLVLEPAGQAIPMPAVGDGWFDLTTREAAPGHRYRYELSGGLRVPDPASRQQDKDVHDASVVVDPARYRWRSPGWRGCAWHETVLYELHVGTFSPAGTFDGVRERLETLAQIGITAIELMPIADFPGRWNWGYDGVLPFAPDARYGTPDQLKALIDAAHERGMMVFLDVVYNHFGPDGNYLHSYAPQFFTDRRRTPWGAAIDYRQRPVRDFYIHNALYWIQEYRFDGLRFDAVHEIIDDSEPNILQEIARSVRTRTEPGRQVHLVLENDDNSARLLTRNPDGTPRHYTAQWNDDFHHAAHVVLTGETGGYYADYADQPVERLGRALAEGFVYQGEKSPYRGKARGEPSAKLPPLAFVNFIQNHDQVGNRAFGERLTALASPAALKALSAILLLAPSVPLLFMGEEYGAEEPFCFFADFHGKLADAVRNGRREEFARFPAFADPAARQRIPDPVAAATHKQSCLDWAKRSAATHREWLEHCRSLIAVRRTELRPRLAQVPGGQAAYNVIDRTLLTVRWVLGDGARLQLVAQLADQPSGAAAVTAAGRSLWTTSRAGINRAPLQNLPPWFVGWFIDDARAGR